MLERVSAALTKFLAPLSGSVENGLDPNLSGKDGFQRPKKQPKQGESKAQKPLRPEATKNASHLKLVPNPSVSKVSDPVAELQKNAGLISTIMDVFSQFHEQRALMRRSGGAKNYETSLKSKGMSQLRKGTIFDKKAE
ncbi:MAG: hypothetical protein ABIQ95_02500 [Bdellovibrionia bacterium]